MKFYAYEFWSGFEDKTNPNHFVFFKDLFEQVFQEPIELGEKMEECDILLETIFSNSTKLFDKKWKHTFLFSGESRLNRFAEYYDCILYGERNHDKIVNVPLFYSYLHCNNLFERMIAKKNSVLNKPTKNICVIVSNTGGKERNIFLEKLEKRIHIDYLGDYKNNSPKLHHVYHTEEFRNHIKDYKFIVSMENSRGDTYITEKITHGFLANTIPVYWGSNRVTDYFNKNRFIHVENMDDENHINQCIERILHICNDEAEFQKVISQPVYNNLFRQISDMAKDIRNLLFSKPYSSVQKIYTITKEEFEPDRYAHMCELLFTKLHLSNDNVKFVCPTYKQTISDQMMKKMVKKDLMQHYRHSNMKKSELSLCINYKAVLKDIEKNYKDGIFIVFESDVCILDIEKFDEFLNMAKHHKEKWDLINFSNEGGNLFGTPYNIHPTPYRPGLTNYSKEYIEDITSEKDVIRLIRKYSSRCTDSFLWTYSGVVKMLKYMNETPFESAFDYYMYNYFEKDHTFKHYMTTKSFFLQGSNVGYFESNIQKDIL